jgi:hypothetical protein
VFLHRHAVCVFVCLLVQFLYVYHCTWTRLNGTLHKSLLIVGRQHVLAATNTQPTIGRDDVCAVDAVSKELRWLVLSELPVLYYRWRHVQYSVKESSGRNWITFFVLKTSQLKDVKKVAALRRIQRDCCKETASNGLRCNVTISCSLFHGWDIRLYSLYLWLNLFFRFSVPFPLQIGKPEFMERRYLHEPFAQLRQVFPQRVCRVYFMHTELLHWILASCKYKTNTMAWVREQTVPTERPPLFGEMIANFCG